MDYSKKLQFHYRPSEGWINDPNGLVWFQGYYHVFYQHAPHFETPWKEPMHWGHARTKNFLTWEELPIALYPDMPYDEKGCWSGTAIVKDDVLYLFYASIHSAQGGNNQSVSVAYSTDGVTFRKYEKNPVIPLYPADGGPDFRDPAVACIDGKYYCVMASGNKEKNVARLLIYESDNLFDWKYGGVMCEWADSVYAECPSFMPAGDRYLLAASVCKRDSHYFTVMYGSFENGRFRAEITGEVDKGPDQYAGQVFLDDKGRNLLISWIPGWKYSGFAEKDVGCMSVPRQFLLRNGKICAYPVKELQHLLKDSDPFVIRTDDGFVIKRTGREDVVYKGEITDLKILRDEYILEAFVNGGEEIYTGLL